MMKGSTRLINRYAYGKLLLVNLVDNFSRNNQLVSIDGLSEKLSTMIVDHTALQWLDLSFNQIAKIGNSFNDLVSLKVLYLHGNSIRPGYSLINR